jgi:hypothetical protein
MSSSSYVIEPGTQDLSAHNGHRVEITGTLAPANSMSGAASGSAGAGSATPSGTVPPAGSNTGATAGSTTTASGAPDTSAMASASGGGQRIQVTSVKMIAASCQ